MFGFLKDKLKGAVDKITRKVETEVEEEIIEAPAPPKAEKPKKEKVKKEPKKEEKKKEIKEEAAEEEPTEEKKGFFAKFKEKVSTKKIDAEKFDELFWELEVTLLENNVAVEVIEKIKEDLKERIVNIPIKKSEIESKIEESLKESIENVLNVKTVDLMKKSKEKKPFVICFLGINGSGKTTTIAKVAKKFQDSGKSVVMAAADTFRAAAIEQLQQHADKLGVKMVKHEYQSDSAAVAFDAVKHAEAQGKDVVLIDTAGRLHSNKDLLDELKKIIRVSKPDFKIFVGESITGNDCVEQAKQFDEAVGIDAIILAKADIDEKGGAALSVSYVTGKPVIYLGTGQGYSDIEVFDKDKVLKSLGF
ncbi:MAG: signal recognition particle-docking protein FtsY [archaeon]